MSRLTNLDIIADDIAGPGNIKPCCRAVTHWPADSTVGTRCQKDEGHDGPHSSQVNALITWPNEAPR